MAISKDQLSRLEFAIELEKKSYNGITNSLNNLFKARREIPIGDKGVEKLRDKLLGVMKEVGPAFDKSVEGALDATMDKVLSSYLDIQKKLGEGQKAGSGMGEGDFKALLLKSRNIEEEMDLVLKQHKVAQEFSKAFSFDFKKMEEASEKLGEGFLSSLNKAKSGDVAGLASSLVAGMGKAAGKGGDILKLGAGAAGEGSGLGAALGKLSGVAAAAAAGIAAVGAAFVALLAVMVMADEQAKDFNRSMLEGAGSADFAFKSANTTGFELTGTLQAGTNAAEEMAWKWRGQAKDFTAMIGQLNQAGLTFKEMTAGAKDSDEATAMLAKHLDVAFVASKNLGVSTAEIAETMGQWQSDFGMGIEEIDKQFAAVSESAASSTMNSKRFYSVVSQATAGMALYNNRMGEAAELLSKTSKILGGTDASEFIKSLTKGFSDQSYVDTFKTIMIAGVDNVRAIMARDAGKMANQFQKTFAGKEGVQGAFEAAMKDTDQKFDMNILSDPAKLTAMLGKMDGKSTRMLIQELTKAGHSDAAMQVSSLSKTSKASTKGVAGLATAMDQLSMGGKLAIKLQGLGNQRISEMSGIELAAYQSYTGQSTQQIEALRRIDEGMRGQWEEAQRLSVLAEKQGGLTLDQLADAKRLGVKIDENGVISSDGTGELITSLDGFVVQLGDKNKDALDNVAAMQDKASAFAQSSVESTTSILSYLQNTMTSMLTNVYDIMLSFYNAYMGISDTQIKMQRDQLAENSAKQAESTQAITSQTLLLESQKRELSTLNKDSEEAAALREQIADGETVLASSKDELKALQDTRGAIERMETTQLKVAGYADAGAAELGALTVLDAVANMGAAVGLGDYNKGGVLDVVAQANDEAGMSWVEQDAELAGFAGATLWGGMTAPGQVAMGVGGAAAGVVGSGVDAAFSPYAEDDWRSKTETDYAGDLQRAMESPVDDVVLQEQADISSELLDQNDSSGKTLEEQEALTKKAMAKDKKWQDSGFEKASVGAQIDALKAYEGWKLATAAGITDPKLLDKAIQEFADGKTAAGKGILSKTLTEKGQLGNLTPYVGGEKQDFVMRPGQSAQAFNANDTIVGFKPNGPMAASGGAGGAGGGGVVNITVNGGDQAKVFQTVKDALKSSGLR